MIIYFVCVCVCLTFYYILNIIHLLSNITIYFKFITSSMHNKKIEKLKKTTLN